MLNFLQGKGERLQNTVIPIPTPYQMQSDPLKGHRLWSRSEINTPLYKLTILCDSLLTFQLLLLKDGPIHHSCGEVCPDTIPQLRLGTPGSSVPTASAEISQ